VGQHLLDGDARALALVEHHIYQVFGLLRDIAPYIIVKGELLRHYVFGGKPLVMGEEGQAQGQHYMQNYAKAPHISAIGMGMVVDYLWRTNIKC
jgi:hypothetical protein